MTNAKLSLRAMLAAATLSVWLASPLLLSGQDTAPSKDEKRRVFDKDKRFSIIPPPGWDNQPKRVGQDTILARQGSAKDLGANFNIRVVKTPDVSDEEWSAGIKQAVEVYKLQTPGYKLDEERELRINGRIAYLHSFSFTRGNNAYSAAVFNIRGGQGNCYILTFTIAPSVYERLKPIIKQSAETVRIEKP